MVGCRDADVKRLHRRDVIVRRFAAEYLTRTREGMWQDDRTALADLRLGDCDRVLDVGCGTGEFTRVLAAETDGLVVGVDRDAGLLDGVALPAVRGDALQLPFPDDTFDLVVCQALLVNLPDPPAAIREFARTSRGRVATVEPDNAAVTVTSTVDGEERLARRARGYYLGGVETDVTLGPDAGDLLEAAGLSDVTVRRHVRELTVEPPYSAADVEAASRKATGRDLRDRRETMSGDDERLDDLRERWRAMGREVVRQVRAGEYRRRETVPMYVTVGGG